MPNIACSINRARTIDNPSPMLFVTVALTLLAISTLASFMPAREATKVNPATTLRD